MQINAAHEQFNSEQYPASLRLRKFEQHVLGLPMLVSSMAFHDLNSDSPNVFLHERHIRNGIYLSFLHTSGFISSSHPRELDARKGNIVVGMLRSGHADMRTERERFALGQGDVYVNATSNFESTYAESEVARMIFPAGPLKELFCRTGEFVVFRKNQPATEILKSTISGLEKTLREGDELEVDRMGRLAVDLSSRIIEENIFSNAYSGYEIIRERAQEFIHDNFASQDLTIDKIAAYVGASRSTLYRSFHIWGGVREYITSIRLERARKLIDYGASDRVQLSNIAHACGYNSVGQLGAAFKSHFGVTPTQYKNGDNIRQASA